MNDPQAHGGLMQMPTPMMPIAPITPISIHTEHGPLHGELTLTPGASGLIILVHADPEPASHDDALAARLRQRGFATLTLELLPQSEERFADVHHNVSLLARRLLDGLHLIRRQMENEALPTLPLGLCAAGHASPVVVRVAALRDHDIAAIVCRGGLIDLAGMLYLRSLASPLLMLLGENEPAQVASSQRALKEIACPTALEVIAATDSRFDSPAAFDAIARDTAHWFTEHCRRTDQEKS
jgi:hypothetical protein